MSIFDNVAFPKHKRNVFNLSHEYRCSAAFGQLLPVFCEEVLPGDTFQISTQAFVRAMPMVAPLMHRVNIYTHFFFVPNRLVWDEWKDFITGGEDGTAEPVFPKLGLQPNALLPGSLADYLGVSTQLNEEGRPVAAVSVSALPFRAYNLIWNEYYRDQNLQDEIEISKDSGIDLTTPTNILLRNWEKDYFTSALPWTQRGPQSISPVRLTDNLEITLNRQNPNNPLIRYNGSGDIVSHESFLSTAEGGDGELRLDGAETDGARVDLDPNGTLVLPKNSDGMFVDINELRRSIALQRWLETNARGGSRYIEQIFSHFGVVSSDSRLQRPEFLGGGRQPLSISEVLQTSQTTPDSDLGDMAGHGISAATTKQFRRYFEEHGYVIGIMSIMPKTSYMQGTRRHFSKFDKFDFAWPEFANLGEQEVWNSELWIGQGMPAGETSGTFGYQSRYAEYKYIPNTVHGDLKTKAFEPWTLVRTFENQPRLNDEFIDVDNVEENLGRIFPVKDTDTQFIVQLYHNFKAIRILPKHVIPSI